MDARAVSKKEFSVPKLSLGKRVAFTLVALLVPVVFFALLEGVLRVADYGDSYPLFVDAQGVEGYRVQNPEMARRYFYGQPTVPTGLQDFFTAQKSDTTLRLVVQGGSTAAGFPFYAGGAFSRMLEQRLQQTYPDRTVEVINTALAAVNSFTLLDIADEVLEVEPDAVLIYAGHNEYYGALGAGSSVSLGSSPGLVRLYLRLQRLRTVQLIRDALAGIASWFGPDADDGSTTLMGRMVQNESISIDSDTYRAGLEAFEHNMSRLIAFYQAHDVPVYLSTIASNERDQKPFVNLMANEGTAARLAQAQQVHSRGEVQSARDLFADLDASDALCAACSYGLAQASEQLGDTVSARAAYGRARDRDGLRFRAPSATNQIIRRLANQAGVFLVDAEEAMRQRSPGRVIGREMMVEHLHPMPAGFFAIADAFYDSLLSRPPAADPQLVSEDIARTESLLTPVDSLVGRYRVLQLTSVWPFEPIGTRKPYLDTLLLRTPIDSIASRLFQRDVSWAEANEEQRLYFVREGNDRSALQAALARVQEYPFDDSGYLAAGSAFVSLGRLREAETYYRAALDRRSSSNGFMMIGSIYLEEGYAQKALDPLKRSLELNAGNVQARYNLAGALALTGQLQEARSEAETVLKAVPGHIGARNLLAQLPPASPTVQ